MNNENEIIILPARILQFAPSAEDSISDYFPSAPSKNWWILEHTLNYAYSQTKINMYTLFFHTHFEINELTSRIYAVIQTRTWDKIYFFVTQRDRANVYNYYHIDAAHATNGTNDDDDCFNGYVEIVELWVFFIQFNAIELLIRIISRLNLFKQRLNWIFTILKLVLTRTTAIRINGATARQSTKIASICCDA